VTAVPLPVAQDDEIPFSIEFQLEVPSQLFVAQDHWRLMQIMSRLQSPAERLELPEGMADQDLSTDRLREFALSVSHRIKAHREEFARECFLANCLLSRPPSEHLRERLIAVFRAAEDEVMRARAGLPTPAAGSPLAHECALAREFVSNQLLELMFHARRAIDEQMLRAGGPHTEALRATAAAFERETHASLQREIAYRAEQGFITPTSPDPEVLEQYLDRVSLLKKHFHQLLFLRVETSMVDARLRNYGTIIGAMAASVFGFTLNKIGLLGMSASLGLVIAALVGAIVYTVQDRIKDLGKTYVPTRLGKRYAQRVTRLFVPPRGGERVGKIIGTIDESISTKQHERPDPLSPHLGTTRAVHVVRYTSRGLSRSYPDLRGRGITSMKQIFRYDLSWLFARLDDAKKPVPILAADGLRVAAAPRCYRFPVRVELVVGDHTFGRSAIAVVHKGGLERLEVEPEPTAPVALAS
jgi:hypothetical protein